MPTHGSGRPSPTAATCRTRTRTTPATWSTARTRWACSATSPPRCASVPTATRGCSRPTRTCSSRRRCGPATCWRSPRRWSGWAPAAGRWIRLHVVCRGSPDRGESAAEVLDPPIVAVTATGTVVVPPRRRAAAGGLRRRRQHVHQGGSRRPGRRAAGRRRRRTRPPWHRRAGRPRRRRRRGRRRAGRRATAPRTCARRPAVGCGWPWSATRRWSPPRPGTGSGCPPVRGSCTSRPAGSTARASPRCEPPART